MMRCLYCPASPMWRDKGSTLVGYAVQSPARAAEEDNQADLLNASHLKERPSSFSVFAYQALASVTGGKQYRSCRCLKLICEGYLRCSMHL